MLLNDRTARYHIHGCLQQDLAAIAGKPLDRYQVNFKDEQRAKMQAFAVLRSSKQGQSVLRHTLKMGRCAWHNTRSLICALLQTLLAALQPEQPVVCTC